MNKSELIARVAYGADISIEKADKVINAFTHYVMQAVASNKEFCLAGLGTFNQIERSARVGRNPASGVRVNIPASNSVKFKAGTALRGRLIRPHRALHKFRYAQLAARLMKVSPLHCMYG